MTTDPARELPSGSNQDKRSDALFLRWHRAWPVLDVHGALKSTPEDFLVIEQAEHSARAATDGPHLYLFLEKRDLTSTAVVRLLADVNGLPTASIGYAGMKDKVAVTRQWFSVPLEEAPPEVSVPDEVRELARLRATKKLRRGWHLGNSFELLLRDVVGSQVQTASACHALLDARLSAIVRAGVPNYFGPQRFGQDNVPAAIAWLPRRRKERNAFRRGLHLSVLRAFLFNEVLSARLADDSAILDGPMWGRGRVQASQADIEFEQRVLGSHQRICNELEFAGLKQERRALRVVPSSLRWNWCSDTTLQLCFALPPGAYATSVLRELGQFQRPDVRR